MLVPHEVAFFCLMIFSCRKSKILDNGGHLCHQQLSRYFIDFFKHLDGCLQHLLGFLLTSYVDCQDDNLGWWKCFFSKDKKWFHHFDFWFLLMAAMPPTCLSLQSSSPYQSLHNDWIKRCLRIIWWCLGPPLPARLDEASRSHLGDVVGWGHWFLAGGFWRVEDVDKTSLAAIIIRWSGSWMLRPRLYS
jgi:hypothetical protein